ncbi:hypothetical protein EV356DRAFT_497312, partial [Viridothelium virens]
MDQEDFNVVDGNNMSCFDNNLPLIGAWRMWYEDRLIFQRDYYHPADARAGRHRKRDDNDDNSCGSPSNTSTAVSSRPLVHTTPAPTASATVDSSFVNVGQLTGTALYTSVSDALASLCPTPGGPGLTMGCQSSSASIGPIAYYDATAAAGAAQPSADLLAVGVPRSRYDSTELRNAMINAIALVTNSSAAEKSCYEKTYPGSRQWTFCNAPKLVEIDYGRDLDRSATNGSSDRFTMLAEYAF